MKNNQKKILALLTALAVAACCIYGCGARKEEPKAQSTAAETFEQSVTAEKDTAPETGEEAEESESGDENTDTAESTEESTSMSAETDDPGTVIENTGVVDVLALDAGCEVDPGDDPDRFFGIYEISDDLYASMVGRSFTEGGQVSRYELRYIRVLYVDFEDKTRVGEMVVHEDMAAAALGVFRDLYEVRYQICKMVLVDRYYDGIDPDDPERGDKCDNASIAEDNTSAFNYRVRSNNASLLSPHAYGYAIDFNPFENPYVFDDGTVDGPPGCEIHADRSFASEENHMLTRGDTAVTIFWNHGFVWGGDWNVDKDYQHFDYVG